ncbi:MAG: YdcF family protein [Gammaproteobacteria bacterium]|nr:YdcF family protein [Gammaproteobacteria bacterium]
MNKKSIRKIIIIFLILGILLIISTPVLTWSGRFLIRNDTLGQSDAVIVLTTGVDYYPRLTEAARIYKQQLTDKIIINGNRKSDTLRQIETLGYKPASHWSENPIRMLIVMGVPRKNIIAVNGEDIFDTVSEAKLVGKYALDQGIKNITIVTSKFHTKRAGYIWEYTYPDELTIKVSAAQDDPFDPDSWWKSGRQIRALLGEYGGWLYYFWHTE